MAKEKKNKYQEQVDKDYISHKGEFITKDICDEYRKMAESIIRIDPQDVDRHRLLSNELQEKYGVTQIEAINILNGLNISDYVNKYKRIQGRIPINGK